MDNISRDTQYLQGKDSWSSLPLSKKAEMIKAAVKNGIYDLPTIRKKYNEFAEGGGKEESEETNTIVPFTQKTEVIITPDTEYNQYLNTLPDNQRFTPNDAYDSYFYWKLHGKPKNFVEAYNKGMFHYDNSDKSYHANSIAYGENGVGYFMKPKTHATVGFETDFYNKGLITEEGGKQRYMTPEERAGWLNFRNQYDLIDDPDRPNYYRYEPKNKHSIGGPIVEATLNGYKNGGSIYIKPSHRGRLTELKKRTGKTEAELYNDGNPAHKKMVVFARNARRWKHGLGGNLFDGTSEESQQMIVAPDNAYITKPPIFPLFPKMEYDWEDAALNRAYRVFSNYNEAKDTPLSLPNTLLRNSLRWIKDNIYDSFPAGVSNCTLSATQWVDPNMPIKSASSIYYTPEKYNYTKINSEDAIPGNIVIAKDPNKESYHTMMISGFADQDGVFNFNGINYPIKKGEPLVTYSRGGHDNSFIQRNIPLSVYTENSEGHTTNSFYRYNYPRESFLPELIITSKRQ